MTSSSTSIGAIAMYLAWICLAGAAGVAVEPDDTPAIVDGLSAETTVQVGIPREHAPWPVNVTVTWRGQYLRQGTIVVRVEDSDQPMLTFESDKRVLTPGSTSTFSFLMPPLDVPYGHAALEIKVGFNDDGHLVDLGGRTLASTTSDRRLVMGLCLPLASSTIGKDLIHALSLERQAPRALTAADIDDESTTSVVSRIQPAQLREEDMPEAGLGWCCCDVVVIADGRLAAMRPRQLQALERWIAAGGSCCLVTSDRLPGAITQMLTPAGMPAEHTSDQHLHLHLGLGRVVLAPDPTASPVEAAAWRQDALFLWKFRLDRMRELHEDYDLTRAYARLVADGKTDEPSQSQGTPTRHRYMAMTYDTIESELMDALWPDQATAIPIWLIITIFLAFVAAVGPLDWFLLGWLRAHRYTWLFFPAMAIASTWTTVAISRSYLGSHDQLQQLEIVDLGAADAVLRSNLISLVFNGGAHTEVVAHTNAIWSPLSAGSMTSRYRGRRLHGSAEQPLAHYQGTVPNHYEVSREIPQWTPLLSREMSLEPATAPWALGLDRITDIPSVDAVAVAWAKSVGGQGMVVLYHGPTIVQRWGKSEVMVHKDALTTSRWFNDLNRQEPHGWFAFACGESPAGGATYDDLPPLDPGDPDQFLVVFVLPQPNHLVIARRVFHIPHAATSPARSPR